MDPHAEATPIPAHVPLDLVKPYPLVVGATTSEDPFKRMIPDLHQWPEVFYSEHAYPVGRPAWVLRKARHLKQVYQDTANFSSQHFSPFAKMIGENWTQIPAETDPPMHSSYRALLNPLFSPKRMAALEDSVRQAARKYIAAFKDRGECEFMQQFAFPFPVSVFLDLVELPKDRMPEFLKWEHGLLHEGDISKMIDAIKNVVGYLREVIQERSKNPGNDFISYGIHAEIQGRKLTQDELIGFCFGLFIGGLDTVSTNIALHFRHLAENPEHQRRLRNDPKLIPTAMEELLRAYAAVTTFRTCINETQVGGVTFKPGDKVAMCTTLAARDSEEYERPNEVDLDRQPTHMTFAYGPHRCIGSHLARREIQVALEEFLAAVPEFRIKEGAQITTALGGMIQPVTLPLIWC